LSHNLVAFLIALLGPYACRDPATPLPPPRPTVPQASLEALSTGPLLAHDPAAGNPVEPDKKGSENQGSLTYPFAVYGVGGIGGTAGSGGVPGIGGISGSGGFEGIGGGGRRSFGGSGRGGSSKGAPLNED
jgi:hypothetical protein